MKRRQLMGYVGTGLVTTLLTNMGSHWQADAQSSSLSVQWLGHTCFLFTGDGAKILVNPFHAAGCTAGYRPPKVTADLVLISSQILDEGAVNELPGTPKSVYEAGDYTVEGIKFQGITTDHDRKGGRQFGKNVAWKWTQAGINILHLGGIAVPITIEQKILFGRPDLLLIPVGGGDKAYNAQEAKDAIAVLNPKLVIPMYYLTEAAKGECNISPLDNFLKLMTDSSVQRSNSDTISINSKNLSQQKPIQVLSYKFS